MSPAEISDHANCRAGGGSVTDRDAEIAVKIVGLLLGRPFDERHAIGPARIVAAYRLECAADERLRLEPTTNPHAQVYTRRKRA